MGKMSMRTKTAAGIMVVATTGTIVALMIATGMLSGTSSSGQSGAQRQIPLVTSRELTGMIAEVVVRAKRPPELMAEVVVTSERPVVVDADRPAGSVTGIY